MYVFCPFLLHNSICNFCHFSMSFVQPLLSVSILNASFLHGCLQRLIMLEVLEFFSPLREKKCAGQCLLLQ